MSRRNIRKKKLEVAGLRVLGLVASPRKSGNSEILVKEMLASLPAEVNKEMIRLTELDIKPCKACYACLTPDASCVIKDDLAFLLDHIKAADAVIVASACYFLGSHTSIKTIGDRLISVLANGGDFAGKKCITAVAYGIPGWEGFAREAVNNFARFLHLEVVGNMTVQAASPGEVVQGDVLAVARDLADRLVSPAIADNTVAGIHTCRGCGSSLLQLAPSGQIRCVMCGMQGKLTATADGFSVEFAQGHVRFSPEGMAQHSRLLAEIKECYIATRSQLFQRRKPYSAYDWWTQPTR
jgi:multimeric flavodoxin WrbA